MAIVDEILYIKSFREQQAETALHRSRPELRIAHEIENQARAKRDDFQRSALRIEDQWYRELCARVVRVRDIENLHASIAGLRRTQQQLDQDLDARLREREQAQEHMKQSSEHHRLASVARSKFTELARIHEVARVLETERREESELEELASASRDREEWGAGNG